MEDQPNRDRDAALDELLVVRCQLGEREAFDDLIARWHPPLWRYALRMTDHPDSAGDLAQEVWLRVVRGLPKLREGARFRAWLFGIARRVLMDRLRLRYSEPRMESLELDEAQEPATEQVRSDVLASLEAGLARLPIVERQVLVLFYLQELTLSEIATVEAVPLGTVKSRLFRARKLLRDQIAEEGPSR